MDKIKKIVGINKSSNLYEFDKIKEIKVKAADVLTVWKKIQLRKPELSYPNFDELTDLEKIEKFDIRM